MYTRFFPLYAYVPYNLCWLRTTILIRCPFLPSFLAIRRFFRNLIHCLKHKRKKQKKKSNTHTNLYACIFDAQNLVCAMRFCVRCSWANQKVLLQHFLQQKHTRAASHKGSIRFYFYFERLLLLYGIVLNAVSAFPFGASGYQQTHTKKHENIDQNTRIDNKILKNYCKRFTWNSKFRKWPTNFTVHFVGLCARFLPLLWNYIEMIRREKVFAFFSLRSFFIACCFYANVQ